MVPSIFRHINIFEKRIVLVFHFSKFFPKKRQEKFSGETGCSKFRGARRSALGARRPALGSTAFWIIRTRGSVGSKLLVDSTPNLGSLDHIESGALQCNLSEVLHYFFFYQNLPPTKINKICGQILVEKIPLPKLNVVLVSIINNLNVHSRKCFGLRRAKIIRGGDWGREPPNPPSPRKK